MVATVELAPDDRPQMIGRPWSRQRATLSLHNAEATLQIDAAWGVRDVRCPEELRGTAMQGCGGEDDARALEARIERGSTALRGAVTTVGDALTLTLRGDAGAPEVSLRCQRSDAGLACAEVRGWPVREGFRPPAEVRFARAP